ncbi:hypothetical protein IW262DRAFT_1468551 [Armillaria fumosa]|nr:hypothetical protein IW262DRAFT_1468551 [Armillaria fumosa]
MATRQCLCLPCPHKLRASPFIALPSLDNLPPELCGPPSMLDLLYQALVSDHPADADDQLAELYGHAHSVESPHTVWVCGVCPLEGSPAIWAGAGVFWGSLSPQNKSMCVPDAQMVLIRHLHVHT